MRKLFLTVLIFTSLTSLKAQVTEPPGGEVEQQLEDITASNEDAETEDDSYLIALNSFYAFSPLVYKQEDNINKNLISIFSSQKLLHKLPEYHRFQYHYNL